MTSLNTTPNDIDVAARLRAAKLGMLMPRTISHVIDVALLFGVFMTFNWLTGLGHERNDALFLLGCAVALLYFFVCEWRWGKTLGKKALGLVVVDRCGQKLSFGQALVRTLFRVVEASVGPLCLIGAASVLLSKDSQRLGDSMAETYVVPTSLLAAIQRGKD
jgi:uncharacterized RDD family membrane protein YckC